MSDCLRLTVWSGPRNISTALMYSFRQRPDTTVVDEPLYGHYLATTGLAHPGREEVLAALDCDGAHVVETVLLGECPRPVHFVKNMAHHLIGLDLGFLGRLTNVLLTRDPRRMLVSLKRELPEADLEATGLPQQLVILDRLLAAGLDPIVLDAGEVLADPAGVLGALCDRLGIAFTTAMLSWPAGPKPEDGVWARHWYTNVHRSTGFAPPRTEEQSFPPSLEPLLAECLPLYERIARHAIRRD